MKCVFCKQKVKETEANRYQIGGKGENVYSHAECQKSFWYFQVNEYLVAKRKARGCEKKCIPEPN